MNLVQSQSESYEVFVSFGKNSQTNSEIHVEVQGTKTSQKEDR